MCIRSGFGMQVLWAFAKLVHLIFEDGVGYFGIYPSYDYLSGPLSNKPRYPLLPLFSVQLYAVGSIWSYLSLASIDGGSLDCKLRACLLRAILRYYTLVGCKGLIHILPSGANPMYTLPTFDPVYLLFIMFVVSLIPNREFLLGQKNEANYIFGTPSPILCFRLLHRKTLVWNISCSKASFEAQLDVVTERSPLGSPSH